MAMRSVQFLVIVCVVAAACTSSDITSTTRTTANEAETTTTAAIGDEMAATTTAIPEAISVAATPSQQEGPYYPVERLADQDNDLTVVDGLDGSPSGIILILNGTLLTTEGAPVIGGEVEIWQTDANGIYRHPRDPGVADRDPYFQGSGAATVAADGTWSFRTIDPGYYEPRPRHIHVKVRVDGVVVLTTQIYFADDSSAAGIDEQLVATITAGTDDSGSEVLLASHRIVLDIP